ncbi:MAG: rhodanese-like domain-containing protein [Syntrophobacteraceae bacterium]
MAQQLASAGFKNVAVLEGGWNAWGLNQYPVEKR